MTVPRGSNGWAPQTRIMRRIADARANAATRRRASGSRLPFHRASVAGIIPHMSPTVFREGGFRFYFFSREESRMHVHVQGQSGEAKFWLEPSIELAQYTGLSQREVNEALRLVQEHEHDIRGAW